MPFIENEDVFKAVNFAASMIKKGTAKGLAIHKAANYYKVDQAEVASNLGKRGAEKSQFNKRQRQYG